MNVSPTQADGGFWHMLLWNWHQGPGFHGILMWLLVSLVAALPLIIGVMIARWWRVRARGKTADHRLE